MERLIGDAISAYAPNLAKMTLDRKSELEEMKEKIRTRPDEVEFWFDKEINKLQNIDVTGMLRNMKNSNSG